jgi:predicted PurR-regulated permease PerM
MKRTDPSSPPPPPPAPVPAEPLSEGQRKVTRYAVVILLLIALAAFVPFIGLFFSPLVLAATFATLLHPLYRWLHRHLGRNGPLAAALTCLLLILCVVIPAYILIHLVIEQSIYLYKTAAPVVQQIIREGSNNALVQRILQNPAGAWVAGHVQWESLFDQLKTAGATIGKFIVDRTYAGIYGLVAVLFLSLFLFFYFLFDGPRILAAIRYLLPLQASHKARLVASFRSVSRATVKGIFIIGLIQGVLGGLTLLICGIKSWLLWGFVTIVVSVIPMAGSHLVLIPAGIVQILLGHLWQGIAIIVVDLLVIGSVDNVLRPRLVGGEAKMHDLMVFFATLGGLSIFGFVGAIIGPAIASFLLTAVEIYKAEFKPQLDALEKH